MPYVVLAHLTFASKAHADHVFNQSIAVATNASVAHIGEVSERSSHCTVCEELPSGQLQVLTQFHIDLFGIVRRGKPETGIPTWIQPQGGHDAYPITDVRGDPTIVSYDGKLWENKINNNSWIPDIHGWEEVIVPDPEEDEL